MSLGSGRRAFGEREGGREGEHRRSLSFLEGRGWELLKRGKVTAGSEAEAGWAGTVPKAGIYAGSICWAPARPLGLWALWAAMPLSCQGSCPKARAGGAWLHQSPRCTSSPGQGSL